MFSSVSDSLAVVHGCAHFCERLIVGKQFRSINRTEGEESMFYPKRRNIQCLKGEFVQVCVAHARLGILLHGNCNARCVFWKTMGINEGQEIDYEQHQSTTISYSYVHAFQYCCNCRIISLLT